MTRGGALAEARVALLMSAKRNHGAAKVFDNAENRRQFAAQWWLSRQAYYRLFKIEHERPAA